jgi:hypothetical protein
MPGIVAGVATVHPGVVGGWFYVPPKVTIYRVPAVPVIAVPHHGQHCRPVATPIVPHYVVPGHYPSSPFVLGYDPATVPLHGVEGHVPTPAPSENASDDEATPTPPSPMLDSPAKKPANDPKSLAPKTGPREF